MKPTQEQQDIIESISKNRNTAVVAVPGSGKTTLLKMIANEYKSYTILYLAYNNSIVKEVSKAFPKNTRVSTVHSLAYRWYNPKKRNKTLTSIKPIMIRDILKLGYDTKYPVLQAIQSGFQGWCLSNLNRTFVKRSDPFIHVKEKKDYKKVVDGVNNLIKYFKSSQTEEVTHDFYLKAFHLYLANTPEVPFKYDIIMLDEAQDASEITKAIFDVLPASRKIKVGDPDQQLYSFLGAVNALKGLEREGYAVLPLTNSFRMPQSVADMANSWISFMKGRNPSIKGLGTEPQGNDVSKRAFITRTNSRLISVMLDLLEKEEEGGQIFRWVTVRNPDSIFSFVMELMKALSLANMIQEDRSIDCLFNEHKLVKWENKQIWFWLKEWYDIHLTNPNRIIQLKFSAYLNELNEREVQTAFSLISKVQGTSYTIPELLRIAKDRYLKSERGDEDYFNILTTAHTSKGLEFDSVIVMNDFPDPWSIIKEELIYYGDELRFFDLDLKMKQYRQAKDHMRDEDRELIEEEITSMVADIYSIAEEAIQFFITLIENDNIRNWSNVDEINLLYVAISRAKKTTRFVDPERYQPSLESVVKGMLSDLELGDL